MPNLGDKLKKIKIDIQNKETEAQRREVEAARIKLEKEKNTIRNYFSAAWDEMIYSIGQDKIPDGIKVTGYDTPLSFYKSGFGCVDPTSPKHPHHDVYCEWAKKADENGLVLKIHHEHDGVGIHSWHRIVYIAKE